MRTGILALLLATLCLCGCASQRVATVTTNPESLQDWSVEGRLVLKDADTDLDTYFIWTQKADHYTLDLYPDGPTGKPGVHFDGNPGHLQISSKESGRHESANANGLAEKALGAPFPVEQLGYWLRGLQATADAKTESDSHGNLTRVEEAGWTIKYRDFMQVNDYRLADDISVRRGRTRLSIALVHAETAYASACCDESELRPVSADSSIGSAAASGDPLDGSRWTLNNDVKAREAFRELPPTPAWINRDEFIHQLIVVHGKVPDPRAGLFGPDSMMWKLTRDSVPAAFGAGRALLLQIAHPWITRGIDEHSTVRKDPLERGRRTFKYIFTMVYGSLPQAMEAAHEVEKIHEGIKGKMPYDAGVFKAGSEYSASEMNARIWVQATLWETLVLEYEQFHGQLLDSEKERFYQETKLFAMLFGIPESALPKNWQAFMEYNRSMWESGQLTVTPQTRELEHYLFHPNILLAPLMWVQQVSTAANMPEPLREQYGLEYGTFRQYSYQGIMIGARIGDHLVPYNPVYYEALARINGERVGWFQRRLISMLFGQDRLVN